MKVKLKSARNVRTLQFYIIINTYNFCKLYLKTYETAKKLHDSINQVF
jgi:hypothetical protein